MIGTNSIHLLTLTHLLMDHSNVNANAFDHFEKKWQLSEASGHTFNYGTFYVRKLS